MPVPQDAEAAAEAWPPQAAARQDEAVAAAESPA
jgi:hypothetical protein